MAANDRELALTHQELTFDDLRQRGMQLHPSVAAASLWVDALAPAHSAQVGPSSDRSYETRHVRVGVTTDSGVSLASTTIPG